MLHSQYNRDLINVNIRLCKNFIFTCVSGSYIPCYYCVYKGGSGDGVVSSRDKPWPAHTMQRVIINRSKGWLIFLVIFLVIIHMDFRFELCYSYGFDCNTCECFIFPQSIDLSIHVTSDEKVQFLKGVLGTVFFSKLLADFCSFFFLLPLGFYRGMCRCNLAYGMVPHGRVTCLRGNSTLKLPIICWSFSPITHHFEWDSFDT